MKTSIVALALTLVAVAGFAQAPPQARITLADIMAPAVAQAPAAPTQDQPLLLASRPGGLPVKATCTALCLSGTVSCTSGTCFAQNVSCPTTQGYVTCNGVTTFCPTPCQVCTPGATRRVWYGDCCDLGGKAKEEEVCSADGTHWDSTGNVFCGGPCGPINP